VNGYESRAPYACGEVAHHHLPRDTTICLSKTLRHDRVCATWFEKWRSGQLLARLACPNDTAALVPITASWSILLLSLGPLVVGLFLEIAIRELQKRRPVRAGHVAAALLAGSGLLAFWARSLLVSFL
jgi:hypothetical protein